MVHISCARKATNQMSLAAFGHGSVCMYKITVIDSHSRELIRTDYSYLGFRSWDDMYFLHILSSNMQLGVHVVCHLLRIF